MAGYTPMIQQYLKIKANYKDCFLFFRLGDFYEMFFNDAVAASRELEITLTSRDGGGEERIPMCGIPYHSAANYIKNLVEKGYKVAICEQVEDPKVAKGVVKREVVQLITPGTVMEGTMLEEKENNYLASISQITTHTFVITYSDLSTGENNIAVIEAGWEAVLNELFNRPIKEMVISNELDETYQSDLKQRLQVTLSYMDETVIQDDFIYLVENLADENVVQAFGRMLNYLQTTQKRALDHLKPVQMIELKQYMSLDMYSKRNLELTETIMRKGKQGSLLWVIDQTVTAMGGRMLKKWLERPLLNKRSIEKRFDLVQGFIEQFIEREAIRDVLKSIYDLERLSGRVAFGNVNARDLNQLKVSLSKVPDLKDQLRQFENRQVNALGDQLDPLNDLFGLLEDSLIEDPPISLKDGGIIRDGYNAKLDDYRYASRNGKKWIAELEQKEKQETNIKSLKIGYNRVFGYYIEVTRANIHLLPEGKYERKQTLTNAERYITPELKEKEALILEAEEKSIDLEYELFSELREQVKGFIPKLQQLAEKISEIDVIQGFASVSELNDYNRPSFNTERNVSIQEGRHPVIEKVMKDDSFVPNHVHMTDDHDILLITGPNMSGKSTYMRQLALTAIMAQVGCYVPCQSANLPIFDKIFTRIGAADDLVSGQSTFMVEMLEAKHAITNATENSLILLDEIGRGTSTYDGMALAQAIIEYIHEHVHAKTLFSTHYHELTSLDQALNKLKNIHVRAEEYEGKVVFLHQIQDGAADESYGIHVAQLAELPKSLIERATVILKQLEQKPDRNSQKQIVQEKDLQQLSFFEQEKKKANNRVPKKDGLLLKSLKNLNLMEMTPMEAMNELYRLHKQANEE
ncbi:DNA mismatch repair protein MutS [Aquibacillus koreensis]|uniref:DNA mismatch repair protein MutS n=1 Tax=Aquibacillus koreensis TaxID=279446 RepID=A0A9X3WL60_9BACI|nr:DNA mismatch repair protein MutS [Aquibacillus koreensis]MCT2534604.1 DNA mismatch repair protein MutS [Aquibacillus koreensis]MDC3421802.1 DNA mismatch repair protein MutS [Aquibacillus koreensis]